MSVKDFLKDKVASLLIHLIFITFTGIFLSILQINLYAIAFLLVCYIISLFISMLIEYIPKRTYYYNILKDLANLDKKHLLSELIEEPSFIEGKILYYCMLKTNKSMNDEIAKYAISSKEYQEYIELWIHEVKTPIASSKLIIENNISEITESLSEELDVVDYYLEQALFYSRSNYVEKDYIIKNTELTDLVNSVIRKNSKAFIQGKIKLTIENMNHNVCTDTKWLEFILNQIIINAIKYHGENPSIRIWGLEELNSISLYIEDNGIGISEKDLPKIFDKCYTGNSGRHFAKSTGIGLYLCKKLCDKLGLSISIKSKENLGTTVEIVFPKTSLLDIL